MHKFLKIGLGLALVVGAAALVIGKGGFGVFCAASDGIKTLPAQESQSVRQVITADNGHSRTIMWQSINKNENAVVEYRLQNTNTSNFTPAQVKEFTDDGKTDYVYSATLQGLTLGTTYEYRVGYDKFRTAWQTLRTDAGEASFKALVFPDSQSSDYSDWEKLAGSAYERNSDASFFINMGDLVDNGEDRYQWQQWFGSVQPMVEKIPVAPIMGNHETYDQKWEVRMPKAYLSLFTLPSNQSKEMEGQYYSFAYGNARFFVFNTQMSELEKWQPNMLAEQIAWLKQELAQTKEQWKIVLLHKDVLNYPFQKREGRVAGINDIGKALMPIFDEYGVDVVLSAHLHTYRNRGLVYNFERAEKGPLYILTGVAGNVRYPDLWSSHPLDVQGAPQPEMGNYLTLQVANNEVLLETFLTDGTKIDSVRLEK